MLKCWLVIASLSRKESEQSWKLQPAAHPEGICLKLRLTCLYEALSKLHLRIQHYLVSPGKEGGSASSIYFWKTRIHSAELGWRLFWFHSDTYLPLHRITVCKCSSSYPGASDSRWLDKVMGDKQHPCLPGWASERLKDSWRKTSSKSKQITSFCDPRPSRSKKLHLSKRQKLGSLLWCMRDN